MNLEQTVLQVHIEDIIPNRFQPRLNFDEQGLQELAASIKEHGIIQPLVLRKLGNKYEIIAGERRYKAAQIAGLTTVPAVISNIDDNASAEVALVENVQRRNLTAIEEARSYKNLLDKGYLTQDQLAKRMGLSQPAIANKLRLLNLDEEVQQALLEEKISERHARTLLTLPLEEQREWLHRIINERLTVRQLDLELKKEKGITNTSTQEDIPLVNTIPSIEDIKANAVDIRDANKIDQLETLDIMSDSSEDNNEGGTTLATTIPDFDVTTPSTSPINNQEFTMPTNNNNKFFSNIPEVEPTPEPVFTALGSEEPPKQLDEPDFSTTGATTNDFEVFDGIGSNNMNNKAEIDPNPFMDASTFTNKFNNPQVQPAPEFNRPQTIVKPEFNSQINPTSQMEINPNNRFFTPIAQQTSDDATIVRPTVTNTNIDPMAAVDNLKPIEEETTSSGEPKDLKYAIDYTRESIDKLGNQGFYIDVEEIDFPEAYQITMRIHKDN